MTWRTFFYSLLCFAAALVVASAASIPAAPASAEARVVVAASTAPLQVTPAGEYARMFCLVGGGILVGLTLQKAWYNLQKP